MDIAKAWIDRFSPDWVSLQFVPYAFHPKGLCFALPSSLRTLSDGYKVHVMFHETWIGFTKISPLKHRITGFFQKHLLRRIVSELNPELIDTSNPLYQLQLSDEKIEAGISPIFSNIPIYSQPSQWFAGQLAKLGIAGEERASWELLGIFGTIHPEFAPLDLLSERIESGSSGGKKVALLGIGRAGAGLEKLKGQVHERFGGDVLIHFFGEETPEHISEFIGSLDYGVATMPTEFMDKSGTIAAFRAHGIPILESHSVFLPEYDGRLKKSVVDFADRDPSNYTAEFVSGQLAEAMGRF
ncbi:hypothetical protein [Luteolibacter sp. AS25]|uniref:hypothetical protein n=1 Tax=Luteolibacter sp. AS25 TaxID=3135776 RepID=UPI00398A543B